MIFSGHIKLINMKKLIIIWALLISVCYAQSKAGFFVVGGKVITVQDTSSRNYLKAIENAGVVPSVLQNAASNFLVTSEKAIGSYSLMTAQYPFIGGNAATHKFNVNNPVDTDAGFRLAYTGTVVHSANGMQSTTGGYAETFLSPSVSLTLNNTHLSVYSTSNVVGSFVDIGSEVNGSNRFLLSTVFSSFGPISDQYDTNGGRIIAPMVRADGYFLGNRASSTSHKVLRNGTVLASNASSGGGLNSATINILRLNTVLAGGFFFYSTRQLAYASIGSGFTDTQAIQQSRIVTFFNSMQNR